VPYPRDLKPDRKKTLIYGRPGQNQHASQEAWFLDRFVFKRLRA
jgi:hypothetical protein